MKEQQQRAAARRLASGSPDRTAGLQECMERAGTYVPCSGTTAAGVFSSPVGSGSGGGGAEPRAGALPHSLLRVLLVLYYYR